MNQISTTYPLVGCFDSLIGGRSENQDSCGFYDTPYGHLALVCDGMGGGPAGKLASSIAVSSIAEFICNADQKVSCDQLLSSAIEFANKRIKETSSANPQTIGMGTTVAALLLNSDAAYIAHVGDSRIYQFRRKRRIFCTNDHSWVGEMVRRKELTEEQARLSSQSNIITRCLGGKSEELAEIDIRPYEKGDRFLLCTDGIWGAITDKELVSHVAKISTIPNAVESTVILVDEVGVANGNRHDNLTMALFETKEESKLKENMSKRTFRLMIALASLLALSVIINFVQFGNSSSYSSNYEKLREYADSVSILNSKIDSLSNRCNVLQTDNGNLTKENESNKKTVENVRKMVESASAESQSTYLQLKERIISKLNQIKDMKETPQRASMREEVIKDLEELANKAPQFKEKCNSAIGMLKNKIATADGDPKSHYHLLIQNYVEPIK